MMAKRISALLLALSILCCIPLTAHAHDVPQERDDCSIELTVRYDGENVNGGTLTAIKVGYVSEDDGNYFFCRELDHVQLSDIQSAGAAADLLEFYQENQGNYDFFQQTVGISDGKAEFTGLSTGLYLIVQNEAASGYSKLGAFLVSVPYMENGEYQYHVTASIKSELEREPEPEPTTPPPTDPSDPELPQTGQLNWPIPLLAVSGLLLFAAGWVLRFGRKRDCYEK